MSQRCAYRVLVVEDKRPDAVVIEEAFAECGYRSQVQFAASRSQALNLLSTGHFDLMLTNFGTDYEQAERFLDSVREIANCMPIVVLSGILDASPAYRAGANAFVRKENDIRVFFEKIRGIMAFWTAIAELPAQEGHVSVHHGPGQTPSNIHSPPLL